jgi:hypothetical protein
VKPVPIRFLYTNIGRGHPFYLDGIIEALVRRGSIGIVRGETDVFKVSTGLSNLAWRAARAVYRGGASGGLLGTAYNRLRSARDYNRRGLVQRLMGRSLRRRYIEDNSPLVVAHPILVAELAGKERLIYQHGENVVPDEALVAGADTVCVPSEEAADRFADYGYSRSALFVSGLCIEPALVKQAGDAYSERIVRLDSAEPPAGAFFSSGAEPRRHVDALAAAALSAVEAGGKALVFARQGGRLASAVVRSCLKRNISFEIGDSHSPFAGELPALVVVGFNSRREESIFTARLFPWFDYFAAPSHERTNWALGLGLPMFIVGSEIGSFAPLNRDLLLAAGVAQRIETLPMARSFGERLRALRDDGSLMRMAQAGWQRRPIDGFEQIAERLVSRFAPNA